VKTTGRAGLTALDLVQRPLKAAIVGGADAVTHLAANAQGQTYGGQGLSAKDVLLHGGGFGDISRDAFASGARRQAKTAVRAADQRHYDQLSAALAFGGENVGKHRTVSAPKTSDPRVAARVDKTLGPILPGQEGRKVPLRDSSQSNSKYIKAFGGGNAAQAQNGLAGNALRATNVAGEFGTDITNYVGAGIFDDGAKAAAKAAASKAATSGGEELGKRAAARLVRDATRDAKKVEKIASGQLDHVGRKEVARRLGGKAGEAALAGDSSKVSQAALKAAGLTRGVKIGGVVFDGRAAEAVARGARTISPSKGALKGAHLLGDTKAGKAVATLFENTPGARALQDAAGRMGRMALEDANQTSRHAGEAVKAGFLREAKGAVVAPFKTLLKEGNAKGITDAIEGYDSAEARAFLARPEAAKAVQAIRDLHAGGLLAHNAATGGDLAAEAGSTGYVHRLLTDEAKALFEANPEIGRQATKGLDQGRTTIGMRRLKVGDLVPGTNMPITEAGKAVGDGVSTSRLNELTQAAHGVDFYRHDIGSSISAYAGHLGNASQEAAFRRKLVESGLATKVGAMPEYAASKNAAAQAVAGAESKVASKLSAFGDAQVNTSAIPHHESSASAAKGSAKDASKATTIARNDAARALGRRETALAEEARLLEKANAANNVVAEAQRASTMVARPVLPAAVESADQVAARIGGMSTTRDARVAAHEARLAGFDQARQLADELAQSGVPSVPPKMAAREVASGRTAALRAGDMASASRAAESGVKRVEKLAALESNRLASTEVRAAARVERLGVEAASAASKAESKLGTAAREGAARSASLKEAAYQAKRSRDFLAAGQRHEATITDLLSRRSEAEAALGKATIGLNSAKRIFDRVGSQAWVDELKQGFQRYGAVDGQDVYLQGEMRNVAAKIDKLAKGEPNELWRIVDAPMSIWKQAHLLTSGYHVRNAMGGLINNWMMGVENPTTALFARNYRRLKAAGWDLSAIPDPSIRGAFKDAIDTGAILTRDSAIAVGDSQRGLKEAGSAFNPASKNFGGYRANVHVGEVIEDHLRGTLFLDSRLKGMSPEEALMRVQRAHYDGKAVSPFETQVMKRLAPWYVWTRNNFGLQLELMARDPGKSAALLRIKDGLEGSDGGADPLKPTYLSGSAIPVGKGAWLTPDTPNRDIYKLLKNPVAGLVQASNPLLQQAYESGSGQKLSTGMDYAAMRPQDVGGARAALANLLGGQNADGTVDPKLLTAIERFLPPTKYDKWAAPLVGRHSATRDSRGKEALISQLLGLGVTVNDADRIASTQRQLQKKTPKTLDRKASLDRFAVK
jgi:hypothetical protein